MHEPRRRYSLPRLVAAGVAVCMFVSLIILGGVYFTLAARGQTRLTLTFNEFGEFWPEFGIFCGAIVFLPVLLYEIDEWVRRHND